jgi:hypothetical protein
MHSNPASDRVRASSGIALFTTETAQPAPIRRLSPLAALLILVLLSLGGWGTIWVIVAAVLAR